jgi:hypothetical protein
MQESRTRTRIRPRAVTESMQAILLTSSLLLLVAMLGSVAWLATARVRPEAEVVPVEAADDRT